MTADSPGRDPEALGALEALSSLDKLLEHRVRLAVCVLLSRAEAMTFTRLRDATGETDGSLGAHLKRLEEAGRVSVRKAFRERRPVSWYRLTPDGREALDRHLEALRGLIEVAG